MKIAAMIWSMTSRWPMTTLFSSDTITSREWRNSSRRCVIRSPEVDIRWSALKVGVEPAGKHAATVSVEARGAALERGAVSHLQGHRRN